jgi:aspartyl-tRNA(Asn)/glutamyl-tRNA(Gln) amidotransferase subunit A
MKVGIVRELTDNLSADVQRSFAAAARQLRELGATVDEISIPALPLCGIISGIVTWAEATEIHHQWMATRPQDYGDDVRRLLEIGMMIPGSAYVRAQRARARVLAQATDALNDRDVLIAPGAAIPAPKIGDSRRFDAEGGGVDVLNAILRFTSPFDVTGQPAIALPTGLSSDGLPLSMQIVGRPFAEVTVLQVASAYEKARGALPAPPPL